MGTDLFVYGTLMDPDVVVQLLGRPLQATPATVSGFRRARGRGLPYPFAVPEEGARIEGMLLHDVSDDDLKRLDRYERTDTHLFTREKVAAETSGEAWMYVGGPSLRKREKPSAPDP